MDGGFEALAAPEGAGVDEELEEEPEGPEDGHAQAEAVAQICVDQIGRGGEAEQSHQEHYERYEEGMHVHQLAIDELQAAELCLPEEVAREADVDGCQQYLEDANDLKMQFQVCEV